jgi:glucose/arabinose dehydrogenase
MTFYDGKEFPAEYQGDIFAFEHADPEPRKLFTGNWTD